LPDSALVRRMKERVQPAQIHACRRRRHAQAQRSKRP
jgi:hypothetical protein